MWSKQIGAEMVWDLKGTTWGGIVGCKIEAQYKGGIGADSMPSLIIAAGKRRSSLGVKFENLRRSQVRKWGAQWGMGMVAFRWLVGCNTNAHGMVKEWGNVACHRCQFFGLEFTYVFSVFCLHEGSCQRIIVLYTHVHSFLLISSYLIACQEHVDNSIFYILNFIIGRFTWALFLLPCKKRLAKYAHTYTRGYTHKRKKRKTK